MKHTNNLISETSPYLLQHAHNPVNWFAWSDEAFEKAKAENKLLLISIGYSSCHWCHVMEQESFEDETTAKLMNENFICIKVDREERPDVDAVYMHAVQLMTGRGGWPLNCFALPDGRPVYGGTYFPKEQWNQILNQLSLMYKNDKNKFLQYAEDLTEGIKKSELIELKETKERFSKEILKQTIANWKQRFDNIEGGPAKAPKFPLPNNYIFLLRYATLANDKDLLKHVELTLNKMAYGGIYDHIGGGFARYSTDSLWKAPHFEKMLYDNAQLISLYSEAYRAFKNPLYKNVVYETIEFLKREMMSDEGFFYSALDADSEGEEGKFYVWKEEEIEKIIADCGLRIADLNAQTIIKDYFSINESGLWEHGNYILLRRESEEIIANRHGISVEELNKIIKEVKSDLLIERNNRIRPGLDDKSLTSWNALLISGLCDAYNSFDEKEFLDLAIRNANLILTKQKQPDGKLLHSYKNGKSTITGFLEDYSFTIEAFISLYVCTFDETWLTEANNLMQYAIKHFYDDTTNLFFFNADYDNKLISRKKEIQDNVIPASNSSMAKSLFYLGKYFEDANYISSAEKMLNQIQESVPSYGSAYSNWSIYGLHLSYPFNEIVFAGEKADEKRKEFFRFYKTNCIISGSKMKSEMPLLKERIIENKTLIYVCENNACNLPVEEIDWSKWNTDLTDATD